MWGFAAWRIISIDLKSMDVDALGADENSLAVSLRLPFENSRLVVIHLA